MTPFAVEVDEKEEGEDASAAAAAAAASDRVDANDAEASAAEAAVSTAVPARRRESFVARDDRSKDDSIAREIEKEEARGREEKRAGSFRLTKLGK